MEGASFSAPASGKRLHIRRLPRRFLPTVVTWVKQLPWAVTSQDLDGIFSAYSATFYGVFDADGDHCIGTFILNPMSPSCCYLSLVMVAPNHRRKGVGKALLTTALSRLEGQTVILDTAFTTLPFYKQLGFSETGFGNCKAFGSLTRTPTDTTMVVLSIRDLTPAETSLLHAYDRETCGYDRCRFLQVSLLMSASYAIAKCVMDVTRRAVLGYACLLRTEKELGFNRISAFYANDLQSAECLLTSFHEELTEGATVGLTVPLPNGPKTFALLRRCGKFELRSDSSKEYRMSRGRRGDDVNDSVRWSRVYSITNTDTEIV